MNKNHKNSKQHILAFFGGEPSLKKPLKAFSSLGNEEISAVSKVLETKVLSDFVAEAGEKFLGGEFVRKFEEQMCRTFRVKYAVSFNSATTALQAAVAALGIGPGDEIITSPYTMSATPSSVLLNNAIPVFADIDPKTYSLDAESVKKRITPRTKAILVVNIFGGSSDFGKLMPLARKYKLKIIEDNAQSIGAKYGKKYLGTLGDIGVFSFNVHKTLQTGEGGVLVTNNKHLAFRAQLVRNHGEVVVAEKLKMKSGPFEPVIGSNYRLSEIHAAVAFEQLKKMRVLNAPRIELAKYLTFIMKNFHWLETQTLPKGSTHVYYVFPFRFFEERIGFSRDIFAKAMKAEGFELAQGYVEPLYLLPIYQKLQIYPGSPFPFISKDYGTSLNYKKGICPSTELLYEKEFLFTTICQPNATKKDLDCFRKALVKIENSAEELAIYEKKS